MGGKYVGAAVRRLEDPRLANAVEDALAPFGVRVTEGPVTARRVVASLRAAGRDGPCAASRPSA